MHLADSLLLPYNLRRFPEQMKKSLEKLNKTMSSIPVGKIQYFIEHDFRFLRVCSL
jgi:hypothetical protein